MQTIRVKYFEYECGEHKNLTRNLGLGGLFVVFITLYLTGASLLGKNMEAYENYSNLIEQDTRTIEKEMIGVSLYDKKGQSWGRKKRLFRDQLGRNLEEKVGMVSVLSEKPRHPLFINSNKVKIRRC